jgi:flagellar assembly protein FliH
MSPIGHAKTGGADDLRAGPGEAEAPPPPRPPEEELAAIRAAAHAQGHAEGLAEGRAASAREAAELAQLIGRMRAVMDGFEQDLAVDMLGLCVEIARQIMRHTIHVHPEVVLPVIREAIASIPQGSLHPRLMLHPQDAALVRSVLDANQITPAPWRIVEDARLERGGCRVETATSELDASVESRWKAVVASLGREERWVDLDVPPRAGQAGSSRDA